MRFVTNTLLLLLLCLQTASFAQQKVGLVLSGGGAAALSHIGVIKALEENNVPIDYITGTSMGALVGALYATGYSPEEMEAYFTSERFQKLAKGEIDEAYINYFNKLQQDASWISIRFSKDDFLKTTLPTNIISPIALDWELLEYFSQYEALANYDFNKLFVPFRCVAADIENKEPYIFRRGSLSEAVRASVAYPFYLKPLTVDGKVLFDGGIYNNFPSDIMVQDFNPDVIIGSNVSSNFSPPNEDDLISVVKNMLIAKTEFSFPNEQCIMIEPNDNRGTFEFYDIRTVIDSGYEAAKRQIPTVLSVVNERVPAGSLNSARSSFKENRRPFVVDSIEIEGVSKKQNHYVGKILKSSKLPVQKIGDIEPNYYRLFGDEKIATIYPKAKFNESTGYFKLNFKVKKEKEFQFDFGGNFSNKPINTGYFGLTYHKLRRNALTISANTYFGKFYGSAQIKGQIKMPWKTPVYTEIGYTRNRWNYFKSRSVFFEDIKPSYLIQYENNLNLTIGVPIKNNSKLTFSINRNFMEDEYYQTRDFISTDTADVTNFNATNYAIQFQRTTLNRKMYASKGSNLFVRGRFIDGTEIHEPGSTSDEANRTRTGHEWIQLHAIYENYYKSKGRLKMGFLAEGNYANQPLFNNYTATILRSPIFSPLPESKTLFLETFRAFQYVAFGHRWIIEVIDNLDLRLEGYVFQPIRRVADPINNRIQFTNELDRRYTMATANVVFHSPLGPLSASVNYYLNEPEVSLERREPVTFLFHFGYIIFNERGLN